MEDLAMKKEYMAPTVEEIKIAKVVLEWIPLVFLAWMAMEVLMMKAISFLRLQK